MMELSPRTKALIATFLKSEDYSKTADFLPQFENWSSHIPFDIAHFFLLSSAEIKNIPDNELDDEVERLGTDSRRLSEILGDLLLAENGQEEAKKRGAVFTPYWLAKRVTENSLKHWRRLHRSGKMPSTVADVSCGTGIFLDCAEQIFTKPIRIIGIDKDPLSIAYVNLLNWNHGYNWKIKNNDSLLTAPNARDIFADTERMEMPYERSIDLLIGNPPYIRSALLKSSYSRKIRQFYHTTSKGNFDLSIAFIEHALTVLAPGGIASYVLTHKFMTSRYGRDICNQLASKARIINIEDFQDYQIFPGYTTYTCVLTFAQKPPSKRFTITHFPQGIDNFQDPGQGKAATLPVERLNSHPWDFATDATHKTLRLLRDTKHPLIIDIFKGIIQGIRTGANSVYIIPADNEPNIEDQLLIPFVKGEQIRRFHVNSDQLRLIYPYKRNTFGAVEPIDEYEMQTLYPECWKYLCSKREILEQRSKNRKEPWYTYSRSQNLDISTRKKLLIREMMPRVEFAADAKGELAFCSGYALDATQLDYSDLLLWTAVLCTPTMEFSLRHNGTQLHSGWFRLLKHHLKTVRLPILSKSQRRQALELSQSFKKNPTDLNILEALDTIVADAFRLDSQKIKLIKEFLKDCHSRSVKNSPEGEYILDNQNTSRDEYLEKYVPVKLSQYDRYHKERPDLRRLVTFAPNKSAPIHRWYKYTQGFSGDLVSALIAELRLNQNDLVLDPFTGSGTTNLECKKKGIPSLGIEISPLMSFVSKVKIKTWNHKELSKYVTNLSFPSYEHAVKTEPSTSIFGDYLRKAFDPKILAQLTCYADEFNKEELPKNYRNFFKMALISIMEDVSQIRKHGSHYRYMLKSENIGLQKLNTQIIEPGSDIQPILRARLNMMLEDVRNTKIPTPIASTEIVRNDIRSSGLAPESITAVISSPPYLNRNNYIAQQKAELAILNMLDDSLAYRELVRRTIRSHVEGKFKKDPVTDNTYVKNIIDKIVISNNNNPKILHMIAAYFEDLTTTIDELYRILKPGGIVALVLGNTRWGGIVVPVDHLVLKIAESRGFKPENLLITRHKGNSPQQMKQYGRINVRESIVIFKK